MKRIAQILLLLLFVSCGEFGSVPVAVTSVSLNATFMEIKEGEIFELIATISPSNADNKTVIWTSSNASIAVVENGIITAYKAGTAIITATSDDGGKTAKCEVNVIKKTHPVISVELNKYAVELTEGEEVTLIATVNPDNATNKAVTWSSSDPAVASVDNGKVKALKSGTTTVIVKTVDGEKTATCDITVNAITSCSVASISLDRTSAELTEGEEMRLIATVNPDNATNKNVTWSSTNPSVASVSYGNVKALREGNTTIMVWTQDGGKIATCELNVIKAESGDSNEHVNENKGNW
jgi:uncharacterized protein YjdB